MAQRKNLVWSALLGVGSVLLVFGVLLVLVPGKPKIVQPTPTVVVIPTDTPTPLPIVTPTPTPGPAGDLPG
jgi:hypothetical protein